MSIFGINFRKLFRHAQPPRKRFDQTLDLGQSLLTTMQTDSTALEATNTQLQIEKKYNGVTMVMKASLDEIFTESTFVVETETNPIRFSYFMRIEEYEARHLFSESGYRNFYMYNEAEVAADASIIIHVPAGLFISNLDGVKTAAQKLKVAGKSIKYVTL